MQTLQADIATYYAKVWWSTTGRGGKRDTDFNELQTSWDLRRRLDDLVAISESLRNVVATAVLRRTKRSQIALSWALGAVAALAVPQTVLAALQSASPATRSQFHGLFAESVLIRSALIMAGAVLLGLMVVLAYTGLLQVHQLSFVRTSLRRARIYTLARLRGDVQRT